MFVDVAFTYEEVGHIDLIAFGFIAVIDVLRATTTIVNALENGARGVVPVATPGDALALAASTNNVLLAGERDARMIPGFHLGNSPLEYVPTVVSGKVIALTTTNGTQAFHRVQGETRDTNDRADDVGDGGSSGGAVGDPAHSPGPRPSVVAACLRNAAAVVREMAASSGAGCAAGLLVCAGTDGRFSWDDAYCAAVIVAKLSAIIRLQLGDGARAALRLQGDRRRAWGGGTGVDRQGPGADPDGAETRGNAGKCTALSASSFEELQESKHGRRLMNMGLGRDVTFCAETSVSCVVPRLVMGMLVQEGTGGNVVNK